MRLFISVLGSLNYLFGVASVGRKISAHALMDLTEFNQILVIFAVPVLKSMHSYCASIHCNVIRILKRF